MDFIENIILRILGIGKIEEKLLRCQNYRSNSVLKWKKQTGLNNFQVIKLLKAIEIFDAFRIRNTIREIVNSNKELFGRKNLFITSFGSEGKSGGMIAYEFRHTNLVSEKKFIRSWDLSKLPENSTVIFVEDLIGTGSQSTEYILEKLNLLLNPSTDPYLLTICATAKGIEKVSNETNFNVIHGLLLKEEAFQHYSEFCQYFSKKEKEKIKKINSKLKGDNPKNYDCGLLVTFHYSTPNNSMPILWKENFKYKDKNGNEKEWFALLPRKY